MKISIKRSGFVLAVTLILLGMVLLIVVGYLGLTRSDRATTSLHANRLRAKMIADSGLDSAISLLKQNTRYGNYITAMPPQVPAPASHYAEVYRPTDSGNASHPAKPDDFLQLSNAGGDILVSRADPSANQSLPIEPRPPAELISGSGLFTLTNPALSAANSYDFNQVVKVGTNSTGRLVNPDSQAAFGQWVRIRNTTGDLIGRYAFFIEDESMKVNVNVAGNSLGPGSAPNLRVNDLLSPTIPGAASQVEEVDPSGILSSTSNRVAADQNLTAVGASGQRLATSTTTALLDEWKTSFPDCSHLLTAFSKDDLTTARGWQRLNLNALVAAANNNAAKATLAHRIADWIRDAWEGPSSLSILQSYQIWGDERLRLQVAANVIDYIDAD